MKKGKLYTSYFAKINQVDGIKISIARYYPKWLTSDKVSFIYSEISPSKKLLGLWKRSEITEEEYIEIFLKELNNNAKAKYQLNMIKRILDSGKDVILYCYEVPESFCHRHIVGDLFKDKGYEVKEYRVGDSIEK